MSFKNNHKSVRCEIWCRKSFTVLFNLKAYKLHFEVNPVCFSLNILSVNLNFLCDLKTLSKMVPNGSNLMRFYITVKKNCGMYGKHRH